MCPSCISRDIFMTARRKIYNKYWVSNQLPTPSNGNTAPCNHSWSYRIFAWNPCGYMRLSLFLRSYTVLSFRNFKIIDLVSLCDFQIHIFGCRCRMFEICKFPAITFSYLLFPFYLFAVLIPLFWYYYVYSLCFLRDVTNLSHVMCGTTLRCLDSACSLICCVIFLGAILKGFFLFHFSSYQVGMIIRDVTVSRILLFNSLQSYLLSLLLSWLLSCVIICLFSTSWCRRFSCLLNLLAN
jgi:hypothetical protein